MIGKCEETAAALHALEAGVEKNGATAIAAVDDLELVTLSALDVIDGFDPEGIAAAKGEVVDLGCSFPHMEGSVE